MPRSADVTLQRESQSLPRAADAAPGPTGSAGGNEAESDLRRARIAQQLLEKLDLGLLGAMDPLELRRELRPVVEHLVNQDDPSLDPAQRDALVEEVLDETFGFGPLEELLRDPDVTEICLCGPKEIHARRRSRGAGRWAHERLQFRSREHLLRTLERITSQPATDSDQPLSLFRKTIACGWRLSAASGATLPDGPLLYLKRTATADGAFVAFLDANDKDRRLQEALANRRRILVCGAAASGKSMLAYALADRIPADLRVIAVERFSGPASGRSHCLRLVAESALAADPTLSLNSLVNAARDLGPDWLLVDELSPDCMRETLEAALCDGCGVLATLRAHSPRAALCRLERMLQSAEMHTTADDARREVALAFDLLIWVDRAEDSSPRVAGIFDFAEVDRQRSTLNSPS